MPMPTDDASAVPAVPAAGAATPAPRVTGGAMGAGPATGTLRHRLCGLAVALAAAGVLGLAAWFEPAEGGLGTHEQLNLPSCGWIVIMDLPCPTCGMTTAFAHAAEGNLLASARTQPLGFVLAVITAMALLLGTYVAVTGSRIGASVVGLWGRHTGWVVAGAVLAAWGYKIVVYKGMQW